MKSFGDEVMLLEKFVVDPRHVEVDYPVAEFKEFEPRLNFGWFHLKLFSIFQDLSRRLIETGFWGIWDAAWIH